MSEPPQVELPQNLELRSIFDEAYERVAPFFDPTQTWGGVPLEMLAFRILRSAYPELSAQETRQLAIASMRVYRARNPKKAGQSAPEEIALTH